MVLKIKVNGASMFKQSCTDVDLVKVTYTRLGPSRVSMTFVENLFKSALLFFT